LTGLFRIGSRTAIEPSRLCVPGWKVSHRRRCARWL